MILKDEWLTQQISKSVYELKVDNLSDKEFFQLWNEFKKRHSKNAYLVFSKVTFEIISPPP